MIILPAHPARNGTPAMQATLHFGQGGVCNVFYVKQFSFMIRSHLLQNVLYAVVNDVVGPRSVLQYTIGLFIREKISAA